MINERKFRELATITLTCEPEIEPYVGNCSAIDPTTDREQEAWIREELARGNEWAWCCVVVTCTYAKITARDTLNCCSYESQQAFLVGPYYADMVRSVQDDVLQQLRDAERA